MNIVFVGLRGVGKTTLSKRIAKKLSLSWIDTDKEIEKQTGMKIHQIVSSHGWEYFRNLEYKICKQCATLKNSVISTGGGALFFERNYTLFQKNSLIIWLKMPLHHMEKISANVIKRPRLTQHKTLKGEIESLIGERYPIFEKISDIIYHIKNPRDLKHVDEKILLLMHRLCVPIIARTTDDARKKMQQAYEKGALFTELRLDLCGNIEPKKLDLKRTIITPREQKFSTDIKPAFFDLEEHELNKNIIHVVKNSGAKLILSHHDFEKTPIKKDLVSLGEKFFETGADIVKIAAKINHYSDGQTLLSVAQHFPKKSIIVGMGEKSEHVRTFSRAHGSVLTFAALNKSDHSADGQMLLDELLEHPFVTTDTSLYGIIGNPVSYSLSPRLHNSLFRIYGIHAVYLRFPCDNLERDFSDLVKLGCEGFSVTAPYKKDIMRYLDHIDPIAKELDAVNTVVKKHGKFHGYNTDWIGVFEALKQHAGMCKKAVILGHGGAARACAHALIQLGIVNITFLKRNIDMAVSQSRSGAQIHFDTLSHFSNYDYDLVINATSVDNPIDTGLLTSGKIVMDLRYTSSTFLDDAKKKGNIVINGFPMFLYQGLEQFRLWTGKKAGIKDVANIFEL